MEKSNIKYQISKIKNQKSKIWGLKILIAIVVLVALIGGGLWHITACHESASHTHKLGAEKTIYFCPMHPDYTSDKPGECPVCGMTLVQMKEAVTPTPNPPPSRGREGEVGVFISPDRQQLIGVKKAKVEMREAGKTIRTVGKVAFDIELAVAQREYIEAKKVGDQSLANAARQRLILMGMGDEQVKNLREVERNLYSLGKTAWVYPVIFENELPLVEKGQSVEVEMPSGGITRSGKIIAIDPVVDDRTRTARLRVEVPNDDGALRPNMYVNATIESDLGSRLLVPKDAVISSGERNIVFVVHDASHFMPHEVKLGAELADDYVVESGISEGDEVVTGANFLVDAESKLKAALSGVGEHEH